MTTGLEGAGSLKIQRTTNPIFKYLTCTQEKMCLSPDGNALLPKICSYLDLNRTWDTNPPLSQRALRTPGNSSNSTKVLPVIPRISVCFTNVKQSCITSFLRALTLWDSKIRILELLLSLELIKTLSNNNFSRRVSLVYLSTHVAIFTLLASLRGWEHQHQLYVFILSHPSVFLPCFLQPATHRAAFLGCRTGQLKAR